MRDELRSTDPFFFATFVIAVVFFSQAAMAADLTAPARVQAVQPPIRDQRVLDAAKMYEKYFLGQMMKAMRSTVTRSELEKPSMGEGIYREQLDDQYVDSWGERGGIGLADMIHDELVGKAEMLKRRRQAMREAHRKADGSMGPVRTPMALTDRDVLKVRRLPSLPSSTAGSSRTIETVLVSLGPTQARPKDQPESVRSPWPCLVTSVRGENGKATLGLEAETVPARKIELVFDGVPLNVTVGDRLVPGQVIGQLAPQARGILMRQTLVQDDVRSDKQEL